MKEEHFLNEIAFFPMRKSKSKIPQFQIKCKTINHNKYSLLHFITHVNVIDDW